jgi:hypothetical protein|tara:strand:- start:86 stop:604 length:519 start_codon:yes stop_codon:yes gene_type:complete
MAQNRKPPAFQEYASATLANISFRSMNMEARGLLHTMRLECWVNYELPSDLELLSSVLGKPVKPDLLKAVGSFFDIDDKRITCPELEDYRAHLEERREKQSKGGKKGAEATNTKRKATGNPQVPRRGSYESLVQSNTTKQSQNQLIEGRGYNFLNDDGIDPLDAELEDDIAL